MIRPHFRQVTRSTSITSANQDIDVLLATRTEDLRNAFALIHYAYVRAGLAHENAEQLRVTPYQLLESSEIFIARQRNGEVIGTVSLITDGEKGLPLEEIFGDEVQELRDAEIRVGEVSCLADRRSRVERSLPVLMHLMTLLAQTARRRGVNQLLIAVHPRHVRFYQRILGFAQVGKLREYRTVLDRPALALSIDLDRATEQNAEVYEKFFGVPFPEHSLMRNKLRCPEFVREMSAIAHRTIGPTTSRAAMRSRPAASNPTAHINDDQREKSPRSPLELPCRLALGC